MSVDAHVIERARQIVTGAMFGLTTPTMVDAIVSDLADAGLLATPAHDAAVRAETRYVVFDADWCEPPGDVIAVFATKAEAWAHIRGPGDGYGWSVVEVPAP